MTRILLIDGDRAGAHALALQCLEDGIAVRLSETLCEGVRCLLETPVSMVIVDAALVRLSGDAAARLFDAVAPEVPVVVATDAGTSVDRGVDLEVQGFHLVPKPLVVRDVLAKVERARRWLPARVGAAAHVEAVCR